MKGALIIFFCLLFLLNQLMFFILLRDKLKMIILSRGKLKLTLYGRGRIDKIRTKEWLGWGAAGN